MPPYTPRYLEGWNAGSCDIDDDSYHDWYMQDGRKGRLYHLWTISTAGFGHEDYSLKTANIYQWDFFDHPLWIEYPEGAVRLGTHIRLEPSSMDSEEAVSDSERSASPALTIFSNPEFATDMDEQQTTGVNLQWKEE